jgi:hypothetical protein
MVARSVLSEYVQGFCKRLIMDYVFISIFTAFILQFTLLTSLTWLLGGISERRIKKVQNFSEMSNFIQITKYSCAVGGVVVTVLATTPKVRGFKPGRGRWILRMIKSVTRLPSEGK